MTTHTLCFRNDVGALVHQGLDEPGGVRQFASSLVAIVRVFINVPSIRILGRFQA
jgi:hypothetical protein